MHINNLVAYQPRFVHCLETLHHTKNLQNGISNYSDARPTSFLNNGNFVTVAYDQNQNTPQLWLNTISYYHHRHFNFIIWNQSIPNSPANRPSIHKVIGKATAVYHCNKHTIWIYPRNGLDKLLATADYVHYGPFDTYGLYNRPQGYLLRAFPLPHQRSQ